MPVDVGLTINPGSAYSCRDGTTRWVLNKHMVGQSEMVIWDTQGPSASGHNDRLALGLAGKMTLKAFRVLVQDVLIPSQPSGLPVNHA